jgi:hypothetical protein
MLELAGVSLAIQVAHHAKMVQHAPHVMPEGSER